ncbi:hypothetical protein GGR50DRAFT_481384 [Xylaria sp. CBS 124048]|nr:hypothetical protein GGR50DRAFT_481384 [Xylaria sp. CBS 124048]
MNGTPTFTQFNFQSEEELGFGMFDVPSATNHHHHGFHQSIHPAAYPEPFPLNTPNTPLDHLPPQNNVFGFIPRSLVATYADHTQPPTPYPHTKLESPALSSGSSSTPDTHESQRLITPKNTSGLRHVSEDRDDDDDYDDDGSMPLMGPGGRMGKQKARQQQDPGEYEGRDGKRKHFLQRNRVAAMKCRKKKKEWVNDLEETKTGLESHNAHLHMELDGLVDEASRIRAQLMVHANCNDSNIDKWIENEAKRFVIGTGERYDQILAHFSPAQGVGVGVDPQQQQQQQDMSSAAPGSEYTTGGPSLISPLTTPSHIPLTPHGASPAFFTPNTSSINTPRCYPMPAQEAPPYMTHGDVPPPHEEPDYDGMPIALYDHQVG